MSEICAVCGLPKELCVCEAISKEKQKLTVKVVRGKYKNMWITLIEGVDPKDVKGITKKLKQTLACGGSFKGSVIELQGDHRRVIKSVLKELGFQPDNIEII